MSQAPVPFLRNLTSSEIVLWNENRQLVGKYPATLKPPNTEYVPDGNLSDQRVVNVLATDIFLLMVKGLPEPEKNVILIVSQTVFLACIIAGRTDDVAMLGPEYRNTDGKLLGYQGLVYLKPKEEGT